MNHPFLKKLWMSSSIKLIANSIKVVCLIAIIIAIIDPVNATKLSAPLKKTITQNYPDCKFRLDSSFETSKAGLFIPIVLNQKFILRDSNLSIYTKPHYSTVLVVNNTLIYLQVIKRSSYLTILLPPQLPDKVVKQILKSNFVADLIVPEGFVLPKSLKSLINNNVVKVIEDQIIAVPANKIKSNLESSYVFLTSPSSGKIIMLDQKNLTKIADFQTEGTPSSMANFQNKLLITDQAKNRVLILDPAAKAFIDQIDLPKACAPKGIACLNNSNYFYVSESAANNIDVIEYSTKRILMKTRVATGPGKIYITPDGRFIIVLNTAIGGVSMLTTLNQRLLCALKVGLMPNACAISSDSQRAYITNRLSNSISVIDINKHRVISSIPTGNGPTGIVLAKKNIYVATAKDNKIQVFDAETFKLISEIKLPLDVDFPGALAYLAGKNQILVTSESTEAIGILDLNLMKFVDEPVIGFHTDEVFLLN